jgi:hypothetical protein
MPWRILSPKARFIIKIRLDKSVGIEEKKLYILNFFHFRRNVKEFKILKEECHGAT